jgi:hypothetical protein
LGFSFSRKHRVLETRERMIAETSAFLSEAVRHPRPEWRIPTRRVDQGGFSEILRRSAVARLAVRHWWTRTLESADRTA